MADYGTGTESNISLAAAQAAIESATGFVNCIAGLLETA